MPQEIKLGMPIADWMNSLRRSNLIAGIDPNADFQETSFAQKDANKDHFSCHETCLENTKNKEFLDSTRLDVRKKLTSVTNELNYSQQNKEQTASGIIFFQRATDHMKLTGSSLSQHASNLDDSNSLRENVSNLFLADESADLQ